MPFTGADVDSEISQKCKKCCVLLYINKNFKKNKKIWDICCDMLDDVRETGAIHIAWTENQKFRVFTTFIFKVREIY